ncbi:putative alpha-fucosidase A [Fusarium oxysporum f. sp. albedinis]|nr:putative alpha-fucosidase A [Fusarium oxysporum f. sp. albedinis]
MMLPDTFLPAASLFCFSISISTFTYIHTTGQPRPAQARPHYQEHRFTPASLATATILTSISRAEKSRNLAVLSPSTLRSRDDGTFACMSHTYSRLDLETSKLESSACSPNPNPNDPK